MYEVTVLIVTISGSGYSKAIHEYAVYSLKFRNSGIEFSLGRTEIVLVKADFNFSLQFPLKLQNLDTSTFPSWKRRRLSTSLWLRDKSISGLAV